jgi:hypothetical protein
MWFSAGLIGAGPQAAADMASKTTASVFPKFINPAFLPEEA